MLWQDLQIAFRSIRQNPFISALIVVVIAVGIGPAVSHNYPGIDVRLTFTPHIAPMFRESDWRNRLSNIPQDMQQPSQ
jgi:hypothetical protein